MTTYELKILEPLKRERDQGEERYGGPPPPKHGRIIGLDCHPDSFTAAVWRGSTPHDARREVLRENLTLSRLLEWAGRDFSREDLFLMEAGGNSFEIARRLLALGLRVVVLESAHVGKARQDLR